ncbi:hypothetical protein [Flavobacterium sp. C3NV]|uniref:hypothetical protein n=1 Tax=Flavobacterium sp. C3NV TaxID=3393358 RepID=UPI00398FC5B0
MSAEEHYNKSIRDRYDGQHPYYIALFGSKPNESIDEIISLILLFDAIYLAPVDTYLPDREKYKNRRNLFKIATGEYIQILNRLVINDNIDAQVEVLLKDPFIVQHLNKVPISARRQILL